MITDKNLANLSQYGNTQVIQTYADRLIETRRLLKELTEFSKTGHGGDWSGFSWEHIGDLGHVNEVLSGLVKFLGA